MRLFILFTTLSMLAAGPAVAQVSGVDTTQSRQDRAAFPDSTLPQADRYIPEVRKKVSTPLSEIIGDEEENTASPEEVAAFMGLEAPAAEAPADIEETEMVEDALPPVESETPEIQ